ncbi:MAG: hypothetical protein AAGK32_05730, partial [Actinomycetota bacterium]
LQQVHVAEVVLEGPQVSLRGLRRHPDEPRLLEHDLRNMDLLERTTMISSNPVDALSVADIFVLATRHDRHVRLVLEAAQRSIPVVRTTGVGRILGDTPVVVPYLDDEALSAAVVELANDRAERRRLGRLARDAAQTAHSATEGIRGVLDLLHDTGLATADHDAVDGHR